MKHNYFPYLRYETSSVSSKSFEVFLFCNLSFLFVDLQLKKFCEKRKLRKQFELAAVSSKTNIILGPLLFKTEHEFTTCTYAFVFRVQPIPHGGDNFRHFSETCIRVLALDGCLRVPEEQSVCRHRPASKHFKLGTFLSYIYIYLVIYLFIYCIFLCTNKVYLYKVPLVIHLLQFNIRYLSLRTYNLLLRFIRIPLLFFLLYFWLLLHLSTGNTIIHGFRRRPFYSHVANSYLCTKEKSINKNYTMIQLKTNK